MAKEERVMSRVARRRRRKRGCLPIFAGLIFILLVGGGIYAFNVYQSIRRTVQEIHTERPAEQIVKRQEQVEVKKNEPFSILILGIDTGEYGRDEQGRSDVMLVATVNKQNERVTLTSIPRDTRTEIVGYGMADKINHAYAFGGVAMSVNTVQDLLDIPIDYTVTIDMGGFEKLIDAVGGIYITPFSSFEQEGYHFVEGQSTYMDGATALQYSRFRFDDDGDYGRQERHRQVLTAMIKSMTNPSVLVRYDSILRSLEDVITTDLTFDDMSAIVNDYRGAAKNVETYQLSGTGDTIDGVYYDIPDSSSIKEISTRIKKELNLN